MRTSRFQHRFGLMTQAIAFIAILLITNVLQAQETRTITIHLRGVYDSKITLLGISGSRTYKPVVEAPAIRDGETASLKVPPDQLPGECVLRFDYRENETSTPYPSEKHIFIYQQDLELWVSPKYCNNPDSTYFQPGEIENAAFVAFMKENAERKSQLGVLQTFLMNYDDTESRVYQEAVKEFTTRRKAFNQWLAERQKKDRALFVSNTYVFQFVPEVLTGGTEKDRVFSLIEHYFDGMDFKDPLLIRTADINKWMDTYVNLYGQMATTVSLRDSLLSLAGQRAIEKAKKGDPLIYGWMVDYFYRGYEANNIPEGMKILQPYLDDPRCLTTKRLEIERRLKGMETLVPGVAAPGILLQDAEGKSFDLKTYQTPCRYILLMFWSADCSHCAEMVGQIYPWQQQPALQNKLSVVAISLDETETEIGKWDKKWKELPGWRHMRAEAGVRSQVASDYYILATPVMVLLDAATHKVVAVPGTVEELKKAIR